MIPQKSQQTGTSLAVAALNDDNMFVTLFVAGQLFGIPVLEVRDILGPQRITHIPLAPAEVAGSLNLRGRIVTAIDVRTRLGVESQSEGNKSMSVVVDHKGELYSLIVDRVGEVMTLASDSYERNPVTLDTRWLEVSNGIYRLADRLLIVLDVSRLLHADRFDS